MHRLLLFPRLRKGLGFFSPPRRKHASNFFKMANRVIKEGARKMTQKNPPPGSEWNSEVPMTLISVACVYYKDYITGLIICTRLIKTDHVTYLVNCRLLIAILLENTCLSFSTVQPYRQTSSPPPETALLTCKSQIICLTGRVCETTFPVPDHCLNLS